MKPQIYFASIMLVAFSVSSCSKKDNGAGQQPQAGQQQPSSVQEKEDVPIMQIVPIPNQDKLVISTNDAEQILKAAGLSESQIQEHGSSIREGLANSGAVRITINNIVEVGFAVRGDDVLISSRTKGYSIYNIKTGWKNVQKQ